MEMENFILTNTTQIPSTNYTEVHSETKSLISLVERWTIPVICIVGMIGNTFSSIVFLRKSLRNYSSSIFLAIRSFSDNGFLATLLAIWASTVFDLHFSQISGLCQILIYLTYVFGCLSVWVVVFVTFENYIRVCKPFKVQKYCKARYAKLAMGLLCICTFSFYSFPLWTTTNRCIPFVKFYGFLQIMVYADTFITLLLPSSIIFVFMVFMATATVTSCRRRRKHSTTSISKYKSPLTKVTSMLLAVTLTFFILNMPSHVVRVQLMIRAFSAKDYTSGALSNDIKVQSISQLMYYLSLSVNVFIYYIFGRRFRKSVGELFGISRSQVYIQTDRLPRTSSEYPCSKLSSSDVGGCVAGKSRRLGVVFHPDEVKSLANFESFNL